MSHVDTVIFLVRAIHFSYTNFLFFHLLLSVTSPDLFLSSLLVILLPPVLLDQLVVRFEREERPNEEEEEANLRKRLKTK